MRTTCAKRTRAAGLAVGLLLSGLGCNVLFGVDLPPETGAPRQGQAGAGGIGGAGGQSLGGMGGMAGAGGQAGAGAGGIGGGGSGGAGPCPNDDACVSEKGAG